MLMTKHVCKSCGSDSGMGASINLDLFRAVPHVLFIYGSVRFYISAASSTALAPLCGCCSYDGYSAHLARQVWIPLL